MLATQVADEHRHLQVVLRIYEEVFGVEGGIEAVRALADRNLDPVAETLYGRLEHYVSRLSAGSDEHEFLAAVVARHAHEVISAVIDDFGQLATALLATANQEMASRSFARATEPNPPPFTPKRSA